jgi:hypothetical protein
MKSVGGIQGRKKLSNSNLLTSQSVFCFPIGIVKDKIDMKSVENTDNDTSDAKITPQKHISKMMPKLLNVQNSASTSNK